MKPLLRVAAWGRDVADPQPAPGADGTPGQVVLRDPSPVELVWMEELRVHLRSVDVDVTSVCDLSRLFDTYCRAWHDAAESDRWDPGYVVSALGVTLGDALVAQLGSAEAAPAAAGAGTTSRTWHPGGVRAGAAGPSGAGPGGGGPSGAGPSGAGPGGGHLGGARWMVAGGQASTTVAVRDDLHRSTIFPVDAVARRWISAETGWMVAFVELMTTPVPPARRGRTRTAIGRG